MPCYNPILKISEFMGEYSSQMLGKVGLHRLKPPILSAYLLVNTLVCEHPPVVELLGCSLSHGCWLVKSLTHPHMNTGTLTMDVEYNEWMPHIDPTRQIWSYATNLKSVATAAAPVVMSGTMTLRRRIVLSWDVHDGRHGRPIGN